ncbi:MFS transporter [Lactiplantibacillus carotarum]|uniref:MFS transporter n=1 Tax=Lactiplantibacillus carotarum TaxID=2993456 RepID=UPI00298F0940|nr:MFS transporter [Lactiplantibacillus carotarum]
MKILVKNTAFLTLTGADLFETIGTSFFNILLLTYAKGFQQANLLVSIVSIATVLPGVFGIVTGTLADRAPNKRAWLVGTKLVQALLYLLLARLIKQRQVGLLLVIIGINFGSDVLGLFSYSLRMPLLQNKVPTTFQEQAVGINQGIATLMQTAGQALGVTLLALTGDYQLAGLVNAATFGLAALVLLLGYRSLATTIMPQPRQPLAQLWHQIKRALAASSEVRVMPLISSILLMNAVGASLDAVLNLFLLQRGSRLPVSFSVAVFIMNTVFVVGNIAGNLLHTGIFKRWTFRAMMLTTVGTFEALFINLLTVQDFWLVTLFMGIGGFCMGQVNPKLMASLLRVAPPEMVGSISGMLNSLAMISRPIGSIGIVLIYNVVNPLSAYALAMGLLGACGACLLPVHARVKTNPE